ncbi:MAG: iron export ABC transporter permease subunit FetB [Desulfobulbaceae bacterium]|nr:iron export ABC transporter permease subunit FetB [Desulfobulbaceae bacterium]
MDVKPLSAFDLSLAAGLVFLLGILSWRMRLGISKRLAIASLRTTVQLLLIGQVLRILFANASLPFVVAISMVMLVVAGREVTARQHRRIRGYQGWLLGTGSMFISSFTVTIIALVVIIANDPWYTPQYAIPLLGMLLGNTMSGIALSMDRTTETLWQQRQVVEQRLLLGQTSDEATREIRQQAMRTGMMPIINSMAAAGIVSLPGMMTGQILGGSSPMDAVKYQILIMFLICAGTGFGVMAAMWLTGRKLFDDRHRLRLDVLEKKT